MSKEELERVVRIQEQKINKLQDNLKKVVEFLNATRIWIDNNGFVRTKRID